MLKMNSSPRSSAFFQSCLLVSQCAISKNLVRSIAHIKESSKNYFAIEDALNSVIMKSEKRSAIANKHRERTWT